MYAAHANSFELRLRSSVRDIDNGERLSQWVSCSFSSQVAKKNELSTSELFSGSDKSSEPAELECSPSSEFRTTSDEELVHDKEYLALLLRDVSCYRRSTSDRPYARVATILCEGRRKGVRTRIFEGDDRCYKREKCGFSILKDKEFEMSRKVLNGKGIDLQRSGIGKRPRKSDPLTEEEEILWKMILSKENPTSFNYFSSSVNINFWNKRSSRASPDQNRRYEDHP